MENVMAESHGNIEITLILQQRHSLSHKWKMKTFFRQVIIMELVLF